MKTIEGIDLSSVQAVYSGAEGELWELVMGEQIHIGGLQSSMDLADQAGILPGSTGIDLCCCTGAGMRFLVKCRGVASMRGVDATQKVIDSGVKRCQSMGLSERISFTLADVCSTGLPDGIADFVWGEDAWCYVVDKPGLIAEAARLVKVGGTIAFTDWIEGSSSLDAQEAGRFLRFMKFPNIQDLAGYRRLLQDNGCTVRLAQDTGRFASCIDLYLDMLNKQLRYDALRILGFNAELMQVMAGEMQFTQKLAHEGKVVQAIFVATRIR